MDAKIIKKRITLTVGRETSNCRKFEVDLRIDFTGVREEDILSWATADRVIAWQNPTRSALGKLADQGKVDELDAEIGKLTAKPVVLQLAGAEGIKKAMRAMIDAGATKADLLAYVEQLTN